MNVLPMCEPEAKNCEIKTDEISCIFNNTVYHKPNTDYYPRENDKKSSLWCTQPVVSTLNQVCPIPENRSGSAKLIPDDHPDVGRCITIYQLNSAVITERYKTDKAIPKGI